MKLIFGSKTCHMCGKKYDKALSNCPYCHEEDVYGKEDYRLKDFSHTTPLKFYKEIIIFLVGSFGLSITAMLIELLSTFFMTSYYSTQGMSVEEIRSTITSYFSSANGLAMIEFIAYSILFAGLCLILWGDIKRLLLSFKSKKIFLGFAFGAALMAISYIWNIIGSLILSNVGIDDSTNANQSAINSLVSSFPILSLLIFGLVGPLCEEITYRVGLFGFLKRISNWFAYVAVALIFGLIHFDFSSFGDTNALIVELISLPNYIIAGIGLSYVYDKFGFGTAWIAHATNNFVGILISVISNQIR